MNCPLCNLTLKQRKVNDLTLDFCPKCEGTWFDPGELKPFLNWLVEKGNIPSAEIELDKEILTKYQIKESGKLCPRCSIDMEVFNYAYDSNIFLNRCDRCGGIWADREEALKLATHIKGNPLMLDLGKAIYEEIEERDRQQIKSLGVPFIITFIPIALGDINKRKVIPWSVISIIAINILVFIYEIFFVADVEIFFNKYGLIATKVLKGEQFFSFFTSMFIHAGFGHLLGNMIYLWIFGDNLEERLGRLRFIMFYLLIGVSSGFFEIMIHANSNLPIVGASGAISGVMGGYFIFYPQARIRTLFINSIVYIQAFFYLGFWILLQIFLGMVSLGGKVEVAWFSHVGGFVVAVVLMYWYKKLKC